MRPREQNGGMFAMLKYAVNYIADQHANLQFLRLI